MNSNQIINQVTNLNIIAGIKLGTMAGTDTRPDLSVEQVREAINQWMAELAKLNNTGKAIKTPRAC